MLDDVHDAVRDLVELMETYKVRNRFSQVLTASLFKRRQQEAEALIDQSISRLQVMCVYACGCCLRACYITVIGAS